MCLLSKWYASGALLLPVLRASTFDRQDLYAIATAVKFDETDHRVLEYDSRDGTISLLYTEQWNARHVDATCRPHE